MTIKLKTKFGFVLGIFLIIAGFFFFGESLISATIEEGASYFWVSILSLFAGTLILAVSVED